MANSYTWKIDHLDTALTENDLQKVVKSCRWTVTAKDDSDPAVTTSTYGYSTFESPSTETFVAYDNLTEQTVLDWVWSSGTDKEKVQQELDVQLDLIKNPPVKVLRNPWAPAETPSAPL